MPQFVKKSPEYVKHRSGIIDATTTPPTSVDAGINMSYFEKALIQVVPSGGANPTVQVYWWSDAAGKFVQEHTPITKAGVGINTSYEFTVDCHSRIMHVGITLMPAAGSVDVYVSGAVLQHPE